MDTFRIKVNEQQELTITQREDEGLTINCFDKLPNDENKVSVFHVYLTKEQRMELSKVLDVEQGGPNPREENERPGRKLVMNIDRWLDFDKWKYSKYEPVGNGNTSPQLFTDKRTRMDCFTTKQLYDIYWGQLYNQNKIFNHGK